MLSCSASSNLDMVEQLAGPRYIMADCNDTLLYSYKILQLSIQFLVCSNPIACTTMQLCSLSRFHLTSTANIVMLCTLAGSWVPGPFPPHTHFPLNIHEHQHWQQQLLQKSICTSTNQTPHWAHCHYYYHYLGHHLLQPQILIDRSTHINHQIEGMEEGMEEERVEIWRR